MGEAGWVGVASLFVAALFAWLNKRDSLRHDADVRELKAQNSHQAGEIADLRADNAKCFEEHKAKDAKLEKCEEKHDTIEARVKKIEDEIRAQP